MIPCLDTCTALKICYQVSCDKTGGRPDFPGGQICIEDRQPRLLYWQAGGSCIGYLTVAYWKRGGRKEFFRASYTGRNASPMSGVVRWMKDNSW